MEKKSFDDLKPIREKPFPSKLLGAALIGDEELKELSDIVKEKSPFRHYGLGNPHKTLDFEEEARKMTGSRYVLAVSSGSAALFCAIAALGIGPGDEVIMPAFGWFSDYNSVVCLGALPVFADIDGTLNLNAADFEKKITPRTKAVIVVHYQGGPAKMDEIVAVAKKYNIKVIEDCAQAFGGQYRGKMLGTYGDIAIASFQANKMITCGEGGLLFTGNEEYFVRAVRYHDLGFVRPVFMEQLGNKNSGEDDNAFAGCQFRMSELQGAFILAQIRKLPFILERCRKGHARVRNYFKGNRHFSFRAVDKGDCGITLFLKFPTAGEASIFSDALVKQDIPIGPSSGCCNILEEYPIKSRKMYRDDAAPFGKGCTGEKVEYDIKTDSPKTNEIIACHVPIGIGPLYSDEDIEDIIKAIENAENAIY